MDTGTLIEGPYRVDIEQILSSNHDALVSRSLKSWRERLARKSTYTANLMKDIAITRVPNTMKQ